MAYRSASCQYPQIWSHGLSLQGRWRAWELHVPSMVNDRVRDWCLRIGHPVGEPTWRLALLSPPPPRYSASGLPIVEVGHEVIIAAYPPLSTGVMEGVDLLAECDRQVIAHVAIRPTSGEPLYLAWPITQEGEHRLRAARGRVAPLMFESVAAEPPAVPPTLTVQPKPLEVAIAGGSSELLLRAFLDGSGPHEIRLSSLGGNATPVITVQCLAPLEVSWSCGPIRGRRHRVPPQEVQHVLAEDLTAGVANGHVFRLHIDAGNFGMLRIYLHPAALTESSTAAPPGMPTVLSLSPHTARRVRWLAQTIPALLERGEITTTPLPSAIRAALARLDDLPEGCTLGQLTVAPRLLLPHLKALARALNQLGPRLLARRGTPPTHDAPQGPSATSRRGQVVGPRRGDTS